MTVKSSSPLPIKKLRDVLGESLQENVHMSSYTTARIGGQVDGLVVVHSALELEKTVRLLWDLDVPCFLVGGGSNILVSDEGLRGVVVLNRAHTVKIDTTHTPPTVWAESGAILSGIAHQVALRGLSGLEWGATVPGTIGGAIYGNAGAFDSDMKSALIMADILQPTGKITWTSAEMEYGYRTSRLKRSHEPAIILSAKLQLSQSSSEQIQAQMDAFSVKRRGSQPPGASLGSMFKNPPGDYAGRLIEAAGLKGTKIGGAEVSSVHANFFINRENAKAADLYQLIRLVQSKVMETSHVQLELEVELLGNWQDNG